MTGNQCGRSSYTKISRRTSKFKISRISRRVFKFQ